MPSYELTLIMRCVDRVRENVPICKLIPCIIAHFRVTVKLVPSKDDPCPAYMLNPLLLRAHVQGTLSELKKKCSSR